MSAHHVLVIVRRQCPADVGGAPCQECIEEPDLQVSIECPGVTDDCRLWTECEVEHDEDALEALYEEHEAHGVEHQRLECGWAVPSDRCWVAYAVGQTDAAGAAAELAQKVGPGRHEVHHAGGSEDDFELTLVAATAGALR